MDGLFNSFHDFFLFYSALRVLHLCKYTSSKPPWKVISDCQMATCSFPLRVQSMRILCFFSYSGKAVQVLPPEDLLLSHSWNCCGYSFRSNGYFWKFVVGIVRNLLLPPPLLETRSTQNPDVGTKKPVVDTQRTWLASPAGTAQRPAVDTLLNKPSAAIPSGLLLYSLKLLQVLSLVKLLWCALRLVADVRFRR